MAKIGNLENKIPGAKFPLLWLSGPICRQLLHATVLSARYILTLHSWKYPFGIFRYERVEVYGEKNSSSPPNVQEIKPSDNLSSIRVLLRLWIERVISQHCFVKFMSAVGISYNENNLCCTFVFAKYQLASYCWTNVHGFEYLNIYPSRKGWSENVEYWRAYAKCFISGAKELHVR